MVYEKLLQKKRDTDSLLIEMIHTLIPASLNDSIVSLTPSCSLKLDPSTISYSLKESRTRVSQFSKIQMIFH